MTATDRTRPTLVYLYGPPASGKLTIAEHLAASTGLPLFHNHLSVNAVASVFPFASPAFTEVLHRLRLDVFATAARAGTSLVFTNNSLWGGADGAARFAAFAETARERYEAPGGRVVFVRVVAPPSVLEERVANPSRRAHGKLLDVVRLREMLHEQPDVSLHEDDLTVDTSLESAADAARRVASVLD